MTANSRAAYFRRYNALRGRRASKQPRAPRPIIALDGEGYTTCDGRHLYTYLAACTESRLVSELVRPQGVDAEDVFDWLLSLPKDALLVGFSLGYDRTKWVESMPDAAVWSLHHPEARMGKHGARAVRWNGYRVNLLSTRFSVKREEDGARCAVWDLFKFFQCSFVKALREWDVGSLAEVDAIEAMKQKRGDFARIGKEEQQYCRSECKLLARLARELIGAHADEGLELQSYFGPGSTAAIILRQCSAEEQRARVPREMVRAVSCAFFGGRFECSRVGPVRGPIYAYDIASAYPYAFCQIPCLKHGKWVWKGPKTWRRARGDVKLVKMRVDAHPKACQAWGPLPHRLPDGNIVFPLVSAGGWAYEREFLAASRLHPGVKGLGAWVHVPICSCKPPFAARFAHLYRRRLFWGKARRGRVLRLGLNSAYGKSAQRVGRGRFRCMVRAGLTTSICRAMLLESILSARDPWNVLELATDSVLSTEPLRLPKPQSFGTEKAAKKAGKAALGAWEEKPWQGGVMLLRPGLRFPLLRKAPQKDTAARGVGVKVLHENRARIMRAWRQAPMAETTVQQPTTFHGAKSTIRRARVDVGPSPHSYEYYRDEKYGRWTDPEPRVLSYEPGPKRASVGSTSLDRKWNAQAFRLQLWELPQTRDARSAPYGGAESELSLLLAELRDAEDEQPERESLAVV